MDGSNYPGNAESQPDFLDGNKDGGSVVKRISGKPDVSDRGTGPSGSYVNKPESGIPEYNSGFKETKNTVRQEEQRGRAGGSTPTRSLRSQHSGEASEEAGTEGSNASLSGRTSPNRFCPKLVRSHVAPWSAFSDNGAHGDMHGHDESFADRAAGREVVEKHLACERPQGALAPSASYAGRKHSPLYLSRSSSVPWSSSEPEGSESFDSLLASSSGSPSASSASSGDDDMIMAEMVQHASLLATEFPAATHASAARSHFGSTNKKFRSVSRRGKAEEAQKVKWKARRKRWPRRKEAILTHSPAEIGTAAELNSNEASGGPASALTGVDRLLDMFTNTTTAGVWRLLSDRDFGSSAGSALRDFWYSAGKSLPFPAVHSTLPSDFFQFFPTDCLQAIFQFLTVTEILRLQVVNTAFYSAIRDDSGAFVFVRTLVLDGNWARLNINERQQMLLQMRRLHVLRVLPSAFTDGSIVIQEVAALVYRNSKTLRTLELFSPKNPLHDETPLHSPFSFKPRRFPHLRCLSLVGCQAFEWAHILSNCPLPAVERFEMTYFPPSSDHWSWQVLPDFTSLGVRGLHRLVDKMPSLERLSLGLKIRFEDPLRQQMWEDREWARPAVERDALLVENEVETRISVHAEQELHPLNRQQGASVAEASGQDIDRRDLATLDADVSLSSVASPLSPTGHQVRRHDSGQQPSSRRSGRTAQCLQYNSSPLIASAGAVGAAAARDWALQLEERHDVTGVDPVGGRSVLPSHRGQLSEADFADICSIAFIRAGATGNLKRIVLKHRTENGEEERNQTTVSSFSEFLRGATSFCYRYVSDMFSGFQPEQ
ncbi:f-box protein [Cystoisospora suis]|uniref:F-box protein n=1 Tax=Cystoisospora suis TaxID=483139 RepID=A0A2C6L3P3_9APIC|nr:f-box protein [Cystoisospora suis]